MRGLVLSCDSGGRVGRRATACPARRSSRAMPRSSRDPRSDLEGSSLAACGRGCHGVLGRPRQILRGSPDTDDPLLTRPLTPTRAGGRGASFRCPRRHGLSRQASAQPGRRVRSIRDGAPVDEGGSGRARARAALASSRLRQFVPPVRPRVGGGGLDQGDRAGRIV